MGRNFNTNYNQEIEFLKKSSGKWLFIEITNTIVFKIIVFEKLNKTQNPYSLL